MSTAERRLLLAVAEALYETTGVPIADRREVADARYAVILEMVAMAEAAKAEKGADDDAS